MKRISAITGAPETAGTPNTTGAPEAVQDLQEALASCTDAADPETAGAPNPWLTLLYDRLRDQALPALITDDTITPAASLWTGSRLWLDAFRNVDLRPGDRMILALSPSAAFVQVLVAALWEGYTIALLPPSDDAARALDELDARAVVTTEHGPHAWTPEGCTGPRTTPDTLRPAAQPPTPDACFLLRTSGTTGLARWVALSNQNVLSVLASHLPHFRLRNGRVLSILPWAHAFGLVLDLFPALLSGAEIIRDRNEGRDPDHLIALSEAWGASHLSAVPLTIQRLVRHSDGLALLRQLRGGVVGGAPVSASLAKELARTQLRVGYGQTEAAPGIALGAPGTWKANYLGRPVGCEVDVAEDGELCFRGPNACLGFWHEGSLQRHAPGRTVATGDLVRREGDDLYFQGRKDDAFKLSNGKLVRAGHWEARLRDAFEVLQDALLFTPDGDHVALALCLKDDADPSEHTPARADLCRTLGSLSKRVTWVTTVSARSWSSSPKGSVDREAMSRQLAEQYRSSNAPPPLSSSCS